MPLHVESGIEPITGYKLVRLLGRGGFGEVWEANAPDGIDVAMKFIRLDSHPDGPEVGVTGAMGKDNTVEKHVTQVAIALR